MNERVKRWARSNAVGRQLIALRDAATDFVHYRMVSDERFIRKRYVEVFGREPDLQKPVTFNEKLQWLKLNDRTALHTQCADKFRARSYVADRIGAEHLIPLLYDTDDPTDIRPENLPEPPFVVKTNHASGGPTFVRDKSAVDWEGLRFRLWREMKRNYYYLGREWQYKNIKPHIVVERLLLTKDDAVPFDYKFHCFNGKVIFVQIDLHRYSSRRGRNLYDAQWNRMPFRWLQPEGEPMEQPEAFEEMKHLAETLAEPFAYARVDFYLLDDTVYFGELTFHPTSGFGPFDPPEWDRKLGDLLELHP